LYDESGQIIGAIEAIRDITDRKKTEEALRGSESKFREMADMMPQIIYETDDKGILMYANAVAFDMFGYAREDFPPGLQVLDMVVPEDRQRAAQAFRDIIAGKPTLAAGQEYHALRKDGSSFPVTIYSTPIMTGDRVTGARGIIVDISARKEVEETLKERERFLNTLISNLPGFVYRCRNDRDWTMTYISEGCREMTGYEPGDFLGNRTLTFNDIIHPDHRERLWQKWQDLLGKREVFEDEYPIVTKTGEIRWVWERGRGVYADDGRPQFLEGFITDITARKNAEEAVSGSERSYRALAANLPGIVYRVHLREGGRMQFFNDQLRQLTGYSADELSQGTVCSIEPFIHPDDRPGVVAAVEKAIASAGDFTAEYRFLHRNGSVRHFFEHGRVIEGPDRHPLFIDGVIFDFTERKQAETLLRAQYDLGRQLSTVHGFNDTLEACLDSAIRISDLDAGGIYIVDDRNGNMDLATHRGLPASFVTSASHFPAGSPQALLIMKGEPVYTRHRDAGVPLDPERLGEGLRAIAIIPVLHENHVVACLNLASHTLDEIPASSRRLLETIAAQIGTAIANARVDELARRNRLNLEATFASIDDFIFVMDREGRIITFNPVVTTRLGYTREELEGQPVLKVHAGDRAAEVRTIVEDMLAGKCAVCPIPMVAKDGTRIPVETRVTRGTWDNRPVLIDISRDVTERERVEGALRKSEEQLSLVIEGSGAGLWDWNIPTGAVIFNERWAEIVGYSLAELAPVSIRTWTGLCHPEDLKRSDEVLRKHFAGEIPFYELEARMHHKDGHWVWVLDRGKVVEWDDRHKPVRMTGTHMDITRLKLMEDALRQANMKLNLLNSVTRHDISNQLMALDGFLALSKRNLQDPALTAEYIAKEERIVDILERQIAFTRYYQDMGVKEPVWQNVDVNISKAVAALSPGKVNILNGHQDLDVFADPLFEKVFYNLIDNALRYGGEGLTAVRISARETDAGLLLACEDDGAGISDEDKKRLFERGYGKNTGFGLFLVREILGITGITIRETSEPGHGARFEMLVPKGMYRFTGK
jgi:PAS domain S-box-containing protein